MENENMDCPLVDITRTLEEIPDRDEPCDRENTEDGTEIILDNDSENTVYYGQTEKII